MDQKTYLKIRANGTSPVRIVLNQDIANRGLTIKQGTTGTVTGKQSGLSVKTDPCPACGMVVILSRVKANTVDLSDTPTPESSGPGPLLNGANVLDQRKSDGQAETILGERFRANVPLGTAWKEMPAGTVVTVVAKYRGYEVRTEPCESCGQELHIDQVPGHKLSHMDGD